MQVGERLNTYSHLFGLALAVTGAVHLLARTLQIGDTARICGALIFTLSSVALYAASAMFHGTHARARAFWQRADHCSIYILIAGSFSPFALVTLQSDWSELLLVAIWGVALFGVWRELRSNSHEPPALRLYLALGWLSVAAAANLAAHLEATVLALLMGGAALYTVGAIFYLNIAGHRHAHAAWHLFVLAGTTTHYVAVERVLV